MADHDLENHMVIDADLENEQGSEYWRTRRMKKLTFELQNGVPQPVIYEPIDPLTDKTH